MKRDDKEGRKNNRDHNVERDLEDDLEVLFKLSPAQFTSARNALAAQLKKSGRISDANFVKTLAKPSISAWAVNQLYWNHRKAFDQLISSGERFHKAQSSRHAGKIADMHAALDARRKSLADLSDLATSLLRDAGHNPTLDILRRVTTTLEAMSVNSPRSDAPSPGRLTHDVDPPGFESLASFIPTAEITRPLKESAHVRPATKSAGPGTSGKSVPDQEERQPKNSRKAKIAAAKVSLQHAKRSLMEARARAQALEAAQKRVDAEAKQAERKRHDAETILEKAKRAAKDAEGRARTVATELEEVTRTVKDAERAVVRASKDLEAAFGESSG